VTLSPFDTAPWVEVDGQSLVSAASALQLMPQNIPRLLRLQRLAAIGAALPSRPGAPRLSPSRLRAILKHPMVSNSDVRSQEDPYDDLYTAEVPFYGGPHLIIQGLTSQSADTAALLLRSVFHSDDTELPAPYITEANTLALVLLRLSDSVCRRSGLHRGIVPPRAHGNEVTVPGQHQLDLLRRAVTFERDALSNLLPASAVPWVQKLSVWSGNHLPTMRHGPDDGLVVTPLLLHEGGIVVANPGELASALRHHLIVLAQEHGCQEQLAAAFHHQVIRSARGLLALVSAEPLGPLETTHDPMVARQRFTMAGDKIIDLAVICDELKGYDAAKPFGPESAADLEMPTLAVLEESRPSRPEETQTMQLVVKEGVGRLWGVKRPRRRGLVPILETNLSELRTMTELDGRDPLFLWRFAQARTRLRTEVEVISWSVLDEYATYRDHGYSFYFDDGARPNLILIETAAGLPLRVEAQQLLDRHEVLSPHSPSFVEVLALYGTQTAPIYFTHPRYGDIEHVVEWDGRHLWIGRSGEVPECLSGFHGLVAEAAAYWMWQVCLAQPDLIRAAAGDRSALYTTISFNDAHAWSDTLAGAVPPGDSYSWVHGQAAGDGHLNLELCTAGAGALRQADNTADRELVRALLTALKEAADQSATEVSNLVEQLAPWGHKRMLHSVEAHEVARRPGGLPSVRTVQAAETANVMDELGAWLSGQGLPKGPVDPDERTQLLNQVVEHYFKLLVATVARLSPTGLLEELLLRDEALLHQEEHRAKVLPSYLACFGPASKPAQDLERENRRQVEAAVASRFLIEYVAATPPAGHELLTLEVYDHMLAIAAELCARATLSDAIRYGFSQSQLGLLDSGRLGVSRGDRYQAGVRALSEAQAEILHRLSLEPMSVPPATRPEPPIAQVEAAMNAEFGFTFELMAHGLAELIALSDEQTSQAPLLVPEADVIEHLQSSLGWSADAARRFIDHLSLEPRPEFMSIGPDACPWRYNRNRSYVRRPLIRVNSETGPALLWGQRRVAVTGPYWLGLVYAGRMRGSSKPMKQLMGTIRQAENKEFERTVAKSLRAGGCSIVANSIAKLNGHKLTSPDGDDLGDIDALGIDPKRRTIIVVEAKDFELSRTPAELSNETNSLLHGQKSAVYKLGRRTRWVRDNVPATLAHFSISERAGKWTVLPVISTSRDLISPRVMEPDIPVIPINSLETWVSTQLRHSSRGAGKRKNK